ncbi:MAG: GNAT family N-acetyltransferase [Actinomycetota bacterium]|nr:GNAT family N-acetyltransferase [Actinomycetota bacterium]
MPGASAATISLVTQADAPAFAGFLARNRAFLQPFEPVRPDAHFTVAGQEARIRDAVEESLAGTGFVFAIRADGDLVGQIGLRNVARGAWQNATLGYLVGQEHNGKGYATRAIALVLRFAFEEARLHRVQAGIMPRNAASRRVLEKNGFRYEGRSLRYLKINGVWEDHDMYALTEEEWRPKG